MIFFLISSSICSHQVARVLEGGAAIEQGLALGDQAFEFDRADFRAVLFLLALPLPVFVVVELALRAGALFVEEVGEMPEKIVEIGFEAGVMQDAAQDVEQVRNRTCHKVRIGKRAGIAFVAGRLIAVEFEAVDNASGRGAAMRGFVFVCCRHGCLSLEVEAAPCGLYGEARWQRRGWGWGLHRGPCMPAAQRSAGPPRGRLFCFAMQSSPEGDAAENKRTRAVALRARLWLPRHSQRPGGGPSSAKER